LTYFKRILPEIFNVAEAMMQTIVSAKPGDGWAQVEDSAIGKVTAAKLRRLYFVKDDDPAGAGAAPTREERLAARQQSQSE